MGMSNPGSCSSHPSALRVQVSERSGSTKVGGIDADVIHFLSRSRRGLLLSSVSNTSEDQNLYFPLSLAPVGAAGRAGRGNPLPCQGNRGVAFYPAGFDEPRILGEMADDAQKRWSVGVGFCRPLPQTAGTTSASGCRAIRAALGRLHILLDGWRRGAVPSVDCASAPRRFRKNAAAPVPARPGARPQDFNALAVARRCFCMAFMRLSAKTLRAVMMPNATSLGMRADKAFDTRRSTSCCISADRAKPA